MLFSNVLLLLACFLHSAFSYPGELSCKSDPSSPNWPSAAQWQAFNKSLNGALLAPLPPAVVCDPSQPSYSASACTVVNQQWTNSSLHSNNPVSVDWPNWQDDACLPGDPLLYGVNATSSCNLVPFPHYVVNASSVAHLATAVKFAGRRNVRLIVKGTGHDLLGRSTAPGLSIWTHYMRGLTPTESFVPESCPSTANCTGVPALTVGAGHVMADIYTTAASFGYIVVGGADPNVGIGGYITGGGHSPISAKYGLAADNVLEMVVVTPTGHVLTANEYVNEDLFWAMRGGGGATFGILAYATLKAYPIPNVTSFIIQFNSTADEASLNNNSNFFAAAAYLNSQLPALSDGGLIGIWTMNPLYSGQATSEDSSGYNLDALLDTTSPSPQMTFIFGGFVLDIAGGATTLQDLLAATATNISQTPGVTSVLYVFSNDQLNLLEATITSPGAVGVNARIGSRLWTKDSLSLEGLADVFKSYEKGWLEGIFTSGPGVRAVDPDSNAVNPAWRETYLHVVTSVVYPFKNATAEALAADLVTDKLTPILRARAPNSGVYLNEANVDEPDFQQAFWGDHYPRLLSIKNKYDPHDVFWCKVCVGSEGWQVDPTTGLVCRV